MTGIYDIHNHIVYGVDDGADTIEDSLAIIDIEYGQGVRGLILTPHYRRGMFESSDEKVLAHYDEVKKRALEKHPDLDIHLGCEVFHFTGVADKVKEHPRFCMTGSKYILLEFGESDESEYIINSVNSVRMRGLRPIIAHAERYMSLDVDEIGRLHDFGAYIQVNADSVIGKDGGRNKKLTRALLDYGIVSFIGSDAHDIKDRAPHLDKCCKFVEKKYGEEYAREIFIENPEKVISEGRNRNAG